MVKTSRPFRVGDRVSLGDLIGEVVTYRNVSRRRQVVQVQTEDGRLIGLTVEIEDGQSTAAPVDMDQAIALAQAVVEDRDPPMPVTTQIRTLATALLAATGEAA